MLLARSGSILLIAACCIVAATAAPQRCRPPLVCPHIACPDPIAANPKIGYCCPTCPPIVRCKHNGKYYNPGDFFPAGDGCNTCKCLKSGQVACTLIPCRPKQCIVNGVYYNPGDTFTAPDGCNTCTCHNNGHVSCTKKFCICPVKGQVFTKCGSACPPTCTNPNPICTKQCVAGCACPRGTVINKISNSCVRPKQCPRY